MEPNNLEGRSRGSSFRRRALTLVGASALTLSGLGAAVFGASQAFAAAPAVTATSSSYLIGSGAVGSLTVSSTNLTANKTGIYTINFTATDGIAAGDKINLTMSDAATTLVTATLTDTTTTAQQPVSVAATVAGTSQPLTVNNKVAAGDSVSLVIGGVTQGAASTTANVTVSTTADTAPVTSADYTIAAAAAASVPTTSVSTLAANATGTTWTLGTFGLYDTTTVTTTSLAAGSTLDLTIAGAGLTTSPLTNYVITDTPSSGSATTQNPKSITAVSGSEVKLVTSAALTVGDTITLTASAVNNPGVGNVTPTLTGTGPNGGAWEVVNPGTAANQGAQAAVGFTQVAISASLTSVTGASISASPNSASTSTQTNTSTYTVGFTSTSAVGGGGSVTVVLAAGTTIQATSATYPVVLTDSTSGATASVTAGTAISATTTPASTTNNKIIVTTPATFSVAKGDVVSVEIFGVQNPQTTGSFTGTVATSGDSVAVSASYSLVAPTTTLSKVNVAVSTSTAGASATYTITNLEASAALPANSTIYVALTTAAPGGSVATQFPLLKTAYQITDLTNAASSGVAYGVVADASGFGNNGVDITTTNAIAANDQLTITISGVINPTAGGSYALQFNPLVQATVPVAAPAAPNAATTGSNGALVNVNGTIYVYAGGVAFGIPTPAVFNTISAELGNPTVVTASSVTTTGTVRNGTLLQVAGSPEIGVVSSGTYYGFSTASQFLSDGYSFGDVIDVPNLGSVATGTGAPANAAATASDGALVNVSGTIYVYAGGVAQGIPTPAVFNTISAAEGNPTVVTASSVNTAGTMATGTLVQVVGSPQVNVVTSTGTQVGFMTASGFTGDGYSWGRIIMIP